MPVDATGNEKITGCELAAVWQSTGGALLNYTCAKQSSEAAPVTIRFITRKSICLTGNGFDGCA